jgi:hypothetical protein
VRWIAFSPVSDDIFAQKWETLGGCDRTTNVFVREPPPINTRLPDVAAEMRRVMPRNTRKN